MSIEIKVPALGESVVEATVARWLKKTGDAVAVDEPVVELETDKVTLEVPSSVSGVLQDQVVSEGDTVEVDALLALVEEGAAPKEVAPQESKPAEAAPVATPPAPAQASSAPAPSTPAPAAGSAAAASLSPAVRRLVEENNLDPQKI